MDIKQYRVTIVPILEDDSEGIPLQMLLSTPLDKPPIPDPDPDPEPILTRYKITMKDSVSVRIRPCRMGGFLATRFPSSVTCRHVSAIQLTDPLSYSL